MKKTVLLALTLLIGCGSSGGRRAAVDIDSGRTADSGPEEQDAGTDLDGSMDAPDAFCSDRDGDTICDEAEGMADLDGDGIPNDRDTDSDGDGTLDATEAGDDDLSTPPADSNDDGVPDFLDPDVPQGPGMDAGPMITDGGGAYDPDADAGEVITMLCPPEDVVPAGCIAEVDEQAEDLCNQIDDDCDLQVDEGCACTPGDVQPCFRGPPGRRGVGACADGMQQCVGSAEFGAWGDCTGGFAPTAEVCDNLDNDCNGCTDEVADCVPAIDCPGPDDPRVPEGTPFNDYILDGSDFYSGPATGWFWTVEGGPCDSILPRPSFTMGLPILEQTSFRPTLSGDYTVTMTVTTAAGEVLSCSWIVHIAGPGLRVEMCYPESETQDLDLFLSQPGYSGSWYIDNDDAFQPAVQVCGWHNCEGEIRGTLPAGGEYPRADWGYTNSSLDQCEGGPLGADWTTLGHCANPRLDIDNNLSQGIGVPENINVDAPTDGETFRVMVQNWSGTIARPVVNVYCGGRRVASYGIAPDTVPNFTGASGRTAIGAMWRVADVTTGVDAMGETTCTVTPLHPPGMASGYDVTYDDPRF